MTIKHLHKIDALRGLAILLVISFHIWSCLFQGYELKEYAENGLLLIDGIQSIILNFNPFAQGWIGVELFLVISGFLIHFIYLNNQNNFTWKEFFSKRFWRIYPPYVLALIFFFIIRIDLNPIGLIGFFTHLFFVHNLRDDTFFSLNPSFWSIALEVQLYVLYPLYILLTKYFKSLRIVFSTFLVVIIFRFADYYFAFTSISLQANVFNFWFTWLIGAYLAERYYHQKKLFPNPLLWFILFYFLFFMFKIFYITNYFLIIPGSLACVTLVEALLYSEIPDKFYLGRIFLKGLTFLGMISYSLYLIHQPYLNNLLNFFNPNTGNSLFNDFVKVASACILLVAISYSMYELVEKRSIEMGKRFREK